MKKIAELKRKRNVKAYEKTLKQQCAVRFQKKF